MKFFENSWDVCLFPAQLFHVTLSGYHKEGDGLISLELPLECGGFMEVAFLSEKSLSNQMGKVMPAVHCLPSGLFTALFATFPPPLSSTSEKIQPQAFRVLGADPRAVSVVEVWCQQPQQSQPCLPCIFQSLLQAERSTSC